MRRRQGGFRWLAAAAALLACVLFGSMPAQAAAIAVLTIVEGDARVTQGARAFAAVVGMRLAPGTLIDTAADASLVRVEWDDGRTLDLGPATRVMVMPPANASRRAPMLYLLEGWAKQATGVVVDAQTLPGLELTSVSGVVVSRVGAERSVAFVESGRVDFVAKASGETASLRQGDSVSAAGSERPVVSPRAPSGFAAQLPRSFRDTIGRRLSQLAGRPVEGKPLPPPSYADLAPWLAAEPAIRRDFPRRFATLARDPAFRSGLQSHLAAHPEWDAVLNPPRTARTATAGSR